MVRDARLARSPNNNSPETRETFRSLVTCYAYARQWRTLPDWAFHLPSFPPAEPGNVPLRRRRKASVAFDKGKGRQRLGTDETCHQIRLLSNRFATHPILLPGLCSSACSRGRDRLRRRHARCAALAVTTLWQYIGPHALVRVGLLGQERGGTRSSSASSRSNAEVLAHAQWGLRWLTDRHHFDYALLLDSKSFVNLPSLIGFVLPMYKSVNSFCLRGFARRCSHLLIIQLCQSHVSSPVVRVH